MLVELHMLQNFAPSCLNRDDTNSPKECEFGGYRRARISSQCLKRAIRLHPLFSETVQAPLGVRTRWLVADLQAHLPSTLRNEPQAPEILEAVVTAVVGRVGEEHKNRAMVFLGQEEIAQLRELVIANWSVLSAAATDTKQPAILTETTSQAPDAKTVGKAVRSIAQEFSPGTMAPDVALFGRMLAENMHMSVNAACQVAHALSTHRVTMEMDFFTAADDRSTSYGGREVGMMGSIEFTSACFYRYSLVSMPQLLTNLGGDRPHSLAALEGFVRASIAAVPSGRQPSTAAHSPPSFIMTAIRRRGPACSLVNAFETPVYINRDGQSLVGRSVEALETYWTQLEALYGTADIAARPVCLLGEAAAPKLLQETVDNVEKLVRITCDSVAQAAGSDW